MLGDGVPEVASEGDRLAVDGEDDVAGLEAAASAGSPGSTGTEMRMHVRQHADVADLEPALAGDAVAA